MQYYYSVLLGNMFSFNNKQPARIRIRRKKSEPREIFSFFLPVPCPLLLGGLELVEILVRKLGRRRNHSLGGGSRRLGTRHLRLVLAAFWPAAHFQAY